MLVLPNSYKYWLKYSWIIDMMFLNKKYLPIIRLSPAPLSSPSPLTHTHTQKPTRNQSSLSCIVSEWKQEGYFYISHWIDYKIFFFFLGGGEGGGVVLRMDFSSRLVRTENGLYFFMCTSMLRMDRCLLTFSCWELKFTPWRVHAENDHCLLPNTFVLRTRRDRYLCACSC